jgi:4-amino-4-deoxy-L-arabinose transferase-like glycosyltransferase
LSSLRRYLPLFTLACSLAALYLYKLDGVGVLGPDEPRYAAIGRAMAQTGDLVTPRLWGSPWFEKPPLSYWMTAAGTWAGLDPELSARLPVALLSLLFLAAAFWLVRQEFGVEAATISIGALGTSAGWVVYSNLCLTDLPLAVFFSLAVLLALPLLREAPDTSHASRRFLFIGVCIGLATLAKGLVPIALAVPFLWFLRRFWRQWWIAAVSFCVVALPWYVAVYARNGQLFIREFFWKHHVERLYSPSLEHVQAWYYYVPVILAGLFPWTPLLGLLALRQTVWDSRQRFLVSIVAFGFLSFSISLNKLPGYLLPLIPSVFVLIGAQFETQTAVQLSRAWLFACALLVAAIPPLAPILPQFLAAGRLSRVAAMPGITRTEFFYIAAPLAVVFFAKRSWAALLLGLCVVAGGIYLKTVAYPLLDQSVSPRQFWYRSRGVQGVCDGGINRDWMYGLSFYRGAPLPACMSGKFSFMLRSQGHGPPVLVPLK